MSGAPGMPGKPITRHLAARYNSFRKAFPSSDQLQFKVYLQTSLGITGSSFGLVLFNNVPGMPGNLFCSRCTYAGYTIHFTNCFGIKVFQGTSGMPGTQFISQTVLDIKVLQGTSGMPGTQFISQTVWTSKYWCYNCTRHAPPGMPGTQFISQTVLDIKVLQGTSGMPGTQFISQSILKIKVLLV